MDQLRADPASATTLREGPHTRRERVGGTRRLIEKRFALLPDLCTSI
jgi:hypothetical protein